MSFDGLNRSLSLALCLARGGCAPYRPGCSSADLRARARPQEGPLSAEKNRREQEARHWQQALLHQLVGHHVLAPLASPLTTARIHDGWGVQTRLQQMAGVAVAVEILGAASHAWSDGKGDFHEK